MSWERPPTQKVRQHKEHLISRKRCMHQVLRFTHRPLPGRLDHDERSCSSTSTAAVATTTSFADSASVAALISFAVSCSTFSTAAAVI